MKRFIFSCAVAAMIGASWSCTNLEYDNQDSQLSEASGAGSCSSDIDAVISSVYAQIGNYIQGQTNTFALMEHTSDEMIGPTRGTDWSDNGVWRSLHAHNWDPTHPYVLSAWNDLNSGLFDANEVVSCSQNADQEAEGRFLRAFFMYHLVDFFGQVPIREVDDLPSVDPRVLSRADATAQIINDLETAIAGLPESTEVGVATKNAARALLTRVYLNRGVYDAGDPVGPYNFSAADMDKVIEYADALTGYQLEDQYFNNFTPDNGENSSELIFSIPNAPGNIVGAGDGPQNCYFMTLHYNQNPSGWNGFTTLADFYNKFEDGDQRKGGYDWPGLTDVSGLRPGFLIGQQFDADGNPINDRSGSPLIYTADVKLSGNTENTGIRVIKYIPDYSNLNAPGNDYVLVRYGEVVLNKAEALLRKGDAGGALALVNELRAARGAAALSSIDEAGMLDERGRELYWEGHRRTDQVRFGTFLNAWSEKLQSPPSRVLFPIPQQAIDSNPNLVQNPGY
jgi:hypothetical protein